MAGLALAPPASAKIERYVPKLGPLPAGADTQFRDRVFTAPTARMGKARAKSASGVYNTPDGYGVEVQTSPSYEPDAAIDQGFVNYVGSLLHGEEIKDLKLYLAPPLEIQQICGGANIAACYVTTENRMYAAGDDSGPGPPVEFVIAHEYGHHIASWRDFEANARPSLEWGPKYWSSYNYVCAYQVDGILVPGGTGARYYDNPGEGFAEAYALYHFRTAPWEYNGVMAPDAGDYRAIRKDVLAPWTGYRGRTFRGRLGAGRKSKTFRLRVHLDGDMLFRLRGPRRSDYNIQIRYEGSVISRTRQRGSRDRLGVEWCRVKPSEVARITVKRRKGSGAFRLKVRYAG